ncbi:MAG: gliding motility-associated C-terminal domain-containing protein [Chitinophagaceae bacterium]|nr:gliding motility-associated C-terminal domain-containing protein [Chitinophagaceae bacterium]
MKLFTLTILTWFIFFITNAQVLEKERALSPTTTCTGVLNTFPYTEDFEINNGNWTTGGTASDWAWGTPIKTIINAAGTGTKCWITGGLSNTTYNSNENAWLMSPCFDFTTLQFPEISFKLFWETEQKFDGASFQYSTDEGNTWAVVGNINSNSNCTGVNWYNTAAVNFIGNINGWSGTIHPTSGSCQGGNGSATWLNAKHTLVNLAGLPNVRFRFLFGAGSICNTFDGFAIDDIKIAEAAPNTNSINGACINANTVEFTAAASCIQNYLWNFGDPASGTANTSTSSIIQHQFSSPGNYTVTLTATFINGPPVISTKNITVIGLTQNTNWPGACTNTPNATLTVTATGSSTPYIYSWNTTPPQTTASIINVGAGNYTVTVNAANACSNQAVFTLQAATPIQFTPTIKDAFCGNANGAITMVLSGGVLPFQYLWSNGALTQNITNLPPANYSLQVKDANGCLFNSNIIPIKNIQKNSTVNLGADANICNGQTIQLNPGNFVTYIWQDGSKQSTYTVTKEGKYYVDVTDADGCSGSDTVVIKKECFDIYFPSAFTPYNNGKNNEFGPLGSISALTNYTLQIFDRYGQQVFISKNPFQKWNGLVKGKQVNNGTYVWMAEFLLRDFKEFRQGTVVLIR